MNIRSIHRSTIATFVLALTATACGNASQDPTSEDALEGAPELAAVQMSLTSSSEDGLAGADEMIAPAELADDMDLLEVPEDAAEDMVSGQHAVRDLNQALRSFLRPIVQLVRATEPDARVGAISSWGPIAKDGVEYRLLLRRAAEGRFTWRLDARPADAKGAYRRIALGRLVRGSEARRGKGAMGVDLDALAELNGDVRARGKLLVGFRHGDAGTTVGYGLRSFTPDVDEKPAIDAVFRGVHLKSGFNRLRLAYHGNVPDSASDAEELVLARLRHARGIGGRSDLVILGGDVPTGQMWVRSQCWTAKLSKTFSEVQLCPVEAPLDLSACAVLETEGDVTACDKTLRDPELPPSDPEAPMEDAKDPNNDVDVPADFDDLVDAELN